jgi:hypothetical protein
VKFNGSVIKMFRHATQSGVGTAQVMHCISIKNEGVYLSFYKKSWYRKRAIEVLRPERG